MNTGDGHFEKLNEQKFLEIFGEPITPEQAQQIRETKRIFTVGEILEIRNSRFRVERLEKRKMVLKLLPDLKTNP